MINEFYNNHYCMIIAFMITICIIINLTYNYLRGSMRFYSGKIIFRCSKNALKDNPPGPTAFFRKLSILIQISTSFNNTWFWYYMNHESLVTIIMFIIWLQSKRAVLTTTSNNSFTIIGIEIYSILIPIFE